MSIEPKRIQVICDVCGHPVGMRKQDGKEYHVNGEPQDGHRPAPRAAGKRA